MPAGMHGSQRRPAGGAGVAVLVGLSAATLVQPAIAERIENNVAVFAALDKVTARISKFEVKLGETVKFGALQVTPRICYSRPATEQPKTTSFVEVDEVMLDGGVKRIFNGWMFAESPGLNAVEHPVFDVWLTSCQTPNARYVAKPAPDRQTAAGAAGSDATAPAGEPVPAEPRRRVRR